MMMASEYIKLMQALVVEYGDLPLCVDGDLGAEEEGGCGPSVRAISDVMDNCATLESGTKVMVIG